MYFCVVLCYCLVCDVPCIVCVYMWVANQLQLNISYIISYIGYMWLSQDDIRPTSLFDDDAPLKAAVHTVELLPSHGLPSARRLPWLTTRYDIQNFYIPPTVYYCVSYGSQNNYRLLRYTVLTDWYVGRFAKLRKATIKCVMYVYPNVCLSVSIEQLGSY